VGTYPNRQEIVARCSAISLSTPARAAEAKRQKLMPFEVLNGAFVFLRRSFCVERPEISSFARLRIFPAGIQPIFAGFQFLIMVHPIFADEVDSARWIVGPPLRLPRCAQPQSLPYEDLAERFESQSRTSAARIARFVAR
jgi:hypothetical protein